MATQHMRTPSDAEKRSWNESLCRIYGNTAADPSLEYNNYRWFHPECVDVVRWNLDVKENKVFEKVGDLWIRWDPARSSARRTRRNLPYQKTEISKESAGTNSQWRPITVEMIGLNRLAIKSQGRYHLKVNETEQIGTWYAPLHQQIGCDEEKFFVAQVKSGKGLIVGDGSYKAGRSSAAIVVQHQRTENLDESKKNTQMVTVPGHPQEQSSYRGELGGILAGIVFANKACEAHNIKDGKCTNDTQADIIGSEKCTIFEACTQVENAFNRAEAPWPKLY